MRHRRLNSLALRFATVLAAASSLSLAAGTARAQSRFAITFQKVSDTDDSVDDFRSGFPAVRQCPAPCQTVHYICRVVNCPGADMDGACTGTPNPLPVTGGVFTDTPPITLPLDCSRGVTLGGSGTSDAPTCDPATNTVTANNVRVPPGGSWVISFWSTVACENGAPTNHAYFQYDQNPGSGPLDGNDPVNFGGITGLLFVVGNPAVSQPTKDAPDLPINMNKRYGSHGVSTRWIVDGNNPNCDAGTFTASWDQPDPGDCLTVDCASLRLFINGVPAPLPPGSLCPDTARPAPFSLGSFTLQPLDTFRLTYDAVFTSDVSVTRCCNLVVFESAQGQVTTADPTLDTRLIPEATCALLDLATSTRLDAVKAAEDAAGNPITTVRPGDDVYWHFTLSNQDITPVDVDLSDDFPATAVLTAGSIVRPFSTGTCVITGQHLQCTAVTLPASPATAEMIVRTAIDCTGLAGGATICNDATVSGMGVSAATHCPTCSPMAPANRTCVTLQAPSFEFSSKTAADAGGDGRVAVGEAVTYTIHALDSGTTDATGVVVRDTIPAGTTYVPGSLALDGVALTDAADGDAGDVSGGAVTVRVGPLGLLAFDKGLVTFRVTLDTPAGAQLCNEAATVQWAEAVLCGLADQVVPPACLDYAPIVAPPVLTASKSVLPGGTVDTGATLMYSVGTCNGVAAGAATGVAVMDDIPAGTTYVAGSLALDGAPLTDAADADAGELILAGTQVRVVVGALAPGACATVTFQVTVDAATTRTVVNVAHVQADAVARFDSNQVASPVRSSNPPQLSISKRSSASGGPRPHVGDAITYTLQACNAAGAGTATAVVIADPIPTDPATGCGASYVAGSLKAGGVAQTDAADADGGRFEPLPAPGGIVLDLPTLDPGTCIDVTFEVVVSGTCSDGDMVTNTSTVSAAGVGSVVSNSTTDLVAVDVVPPVPNLMRKEGFPLANRCPNPPSMCGCEVGPRLDPVADDCLTSGTCSQVDPLTWLVPGDLNRHVPLVFYEVFGAGCVRLGDPTHLIVRKSLPSDILVRLVP